MTIEEKLKDLILSRYKSIREFCIKIDMPYSTMDSMFRRGIGNSSVSNVITVCKELRISADELAEGRITPVYANNVTDHIEIKELLTDTKNCLIYGSDITLDGETADQESIESIIQAIDIGVEIVERKHNKKDNKIHNKNEENSKKVH